MKLQPGATGVRMMPYSPFFYKQGRNFEHNGVAPGAFQVWLLKDGVQRAMLQFDFKSPDFGGMPEVTYTEGYMRRPVNRAVVMSNGTLQDLVSFALLNAKYSAYPDKVELTAKELLGRM